jgi:hypothetical protein
MFQPKTLGKKPAQKPLEERNRGEHAAWQPAGIVETSKR